MPYCAAWRPSETRKRHVALGRQAAQYGIDGLYILGKQARLVRRGALAGGMDASRVVVGKSHGQIARLVRREMRPGDWMLFKGSRGMRMEKVVAAVKGRGERNLCV